MARLPSDSDLGGLPSANSGRPMASIDPSPLAQGISKVGAGITNLAEGVGTYAKAEQRKQSELDEGKAASDWLTQKVNLDAERDELTDPDELEAHKAKYDAALNTAAGNITDPRSRELFLLKNRPSVAQAGAAIGTRQFDLRRDQSLADTDKRLLDLQNTGIRATDPADKYATVRAGHALIDGLENDGYISAQEAQKRRQAWAQGYAIKSITSLPPSQRLAAISSVDSNKNAKTAFDYFVSQGWTPAQASGIVGNLMHESSFNPGAVNQGDGSDGSDSIGIGQWNSSRAVALQKFAAARGKPATDLQTQLEFVQSELKSSESDAAEALRAARTPAEATAAFLRYERPKGYEKGLAGVAKGDYRQSHAEKAFAAFGNGKNNPLADLIPEDKRDAIRYEAEAEIRAQRRAQEVQNKQELAKLDVTINDDLASIERTGKGVDGSILSRDKIASLAGEEAAKDWEAERARSFRIHEAMDGIEQLPEGEVLSRLQAMEPRPGSPGYADDIKTLDKARGKMDKVLEARRSDPALAAEVFDAVKSARTNAQYDEANGVRSIRPESAQAIVGARLAAQSKLGIDHPMAVTKSEAAVLARQLRSIGEENPDGLRKFMEQLNKTYGDYADEVLASTLEHQRVNRELSVMASQMLSKVASGSAPLSEEMRRVDALIDTQMMGTVMPPPPLPRDLKPTPDDRINAARRQGVIDAGRDRAPPPSGDPALATQEGVADVKRLIDDPSLATEFDMKYNRGGPGLAQKILEDYQRRKGVKPNG